MTAVHYMLDLETYGIGHDAAIKSIAVVRFEIGVLWTEGQVKDVLDRVAVPTHINVCDPSAPAFHAKVNLVDSKRPGTLDASTVEWWLRQSDEARSRLLEGPEVVLDHALTNLWHWLANPNRQAQLWSRSPTFDEHLLRNAWARCGPSWVFPFSHKNSRDCRTWEEAARATGTSVTPLAYNLVGHDALHDAIKQVLAVQAQYRVLVR